MKKWFWISGEHVCDGKELEKENSEHQRNLNSQAGARETTPPTKDGGSEASSGNVQSPSSDRSVNSEMLCSPVPSESSRTCSVSQMDTDLDVTGNLNEVSGNGGGGSGLELPGNVTKSFNDNLNLSATETLSAKVVGNLNEDRNRTVKGEGSDSLAGSSREELVLPSMGILPDVEGTPSKVALPVVDTSPGSEKKEQEKSKPEVVPTDPSSVLHKIKKIKWQDIEVPIITQNNNGPCPLLAIVNVMLLKVSFSVVLVYLL